VARLEVLTPLAQARRPRPAGVLLRVRSFLSFARLLPGVIADRMRTRHDPRPASVPVVPVAVHR
jgi:hypothetical protein